MMVIPVRSDFMPPAADFADKAGHPFRNPSQDKESCPAGSQKIKQFMGIFFNPKFTGRPGGKRNPLFKIFHLKPVFYVNCDKDVILHVN
jgi:hypothetical protein